MKKTLGQIVYEHPRVAAGAKIWGPWSAAPECIRIAYNGDADLAKRAVLRELRREGRLDRPSVTWPPGGTYEYPKKKTSTDK